MRYKYVPNAGIEISALTAGTWSIGGDRWGAAPDPEGSAAAIRAMIDGGVNLIDTSPAYGEGVSEEIVGKALKDGYRDKTLVATKFSRITGPNGTIIHDGSYANAIRECDASLKRMGLDYIDLYIQHWPSPDYPIAETMGALVDLKKAGKIRFVGLSNYNREQVEEASKYVKVDFVQNQYSMLDETKEEYFRWCESQGIGVMTYGSLGGGLLTGAVRQMPDWDKSDFRLNFYGSFYKEPAFSKIMSLLKVLDQVAEAHGKPVAQVAINWSTQKSFVSTAICGASKVRKAEQNCAAFQWVLGGEEMDAIDRALRTLNLSQGK